MKKITLTAIALAMFASISIAQDAQKQKNTPKTVYQVGQARVVVWENTRPDGSTWKNFVVEKEYTDKNGEVKRSKSFDANELIDLKAALEQALAGENLQVKNLQVKKAKKD